MPIFHCNLTGSLHLYFFNTRTRVSSGQISRKKSFFSSSTREFGFRWIDSLAGTKVLHFFAPYQHLFSTFQFSPLPLQKKSTHKKRSNCGQTIQQLLQGKKKNVYFLFSMHTRGNKSAGQRWNPKCGNQGFFF